MEDTEKKPIEGDDAEGEGEEEKEPIAEEDNADGNKDEEVDFSKVEPEVRKRPVDYIEERKARRAERDNKPDEDGEVDIDSEEKLTPKAEAILNKRLQEKIQPFVKVMADTANQQEVDRVLSEKPEWKKYAPLARKYMGTPGWDGVPAKRIFQMIDYEYAGKRGAEAERERQSQEKRARGGGSSYRPAQRQNGGKLSAEDVAKLSPDQYTALQKRLAMGESIPT